MKDKNLEKVLKRIEGSAPKNRLTETEREFFNLISYWEKRKPHLYEYYINKYIEILRR